MENNLLNLREEILSLGNRYFEEWQQNKKFVPGETYIPATTKVLGADDLSALLDSSLDLWLTAGRFSREFEREFSSFLNRSTKTLLVNSGSSANLLAFSSLCSESLRGAGKVPLQSGDEVVTAAVGFPTTVNPIIQNGCVPVFIDVDEATLNATVEKIEEAIGPKTKAVFLAHTLGNLYRSDLVAKLCEERGLFLIEDCCDALGASIDGEGPAGSFGQYATFSFYPAHHMTMGEGGAVSPAPGPYKKIAESMRDWGRDCWCEPGYDNTCKKRFDWSFEGLPEGYDHKYVYSNIGYNLKATDMQAAMGLTQMKKVGGFIEQRRANWKALSQGFKDSPHLRDRFTPVQPTQGTTPSWFAFPVHCHDGVNRETVVTQLEEKKIGTRPVFGGNLLCQPAYRNVDYRVSGELEATNKVMAQTFWMGVHPDLTPEKIDYMLDQMENIAKAF